MKLISCHIENYGAISRQDITFNGGVTSFCEQNGYGKTTLASFLESMFYGMETDRANSKELSTRKHYLPFGGGRYGGNVAFTFGGDTYKIERYFDARSEVQDSLTVYKNGSLARGFNQQIGESLFGIDRQSFERTIFINADEIEIGSTGSINAKLGAVVEGGDSNTENAVKRIDKAASEYKKPRVDSGLISQESAALLKLNANIQNSEAVKNSLPEKYESLAECESELKDLNQKLDEARKIDLDLKDWEQYDALTANAEESKRAVAAINERYPAGIPSSSELTAVQKAISAKAALERQTEGYLSPSDDALLAELNAKFKDRAPSDNAILEITQKINALSAAMTKLNAEENIPYSERENKLRKKFAIGVPAKETIAAIDGAIIDYKAAEKQYADTPEYIIEQTPSAARKAGNKKFLAAALIFTAAVAAGIAVSFLSLVAGLIILAVGIIGIIACGFLYLNNKTAAAPETIQRINPEKTAAERRKNNAELKTRQLLAPFGYPTDKNIEFLTESLKSDLADYEKLLQSDAERGERAAALRGDIERLRRDISGFFDAYAIYGDNFGAMLAELQNELVKYNSLLQTRSKLAEQNAETIKNIKDCDGVINKFCEKYNISPADMGKLTTAIADDVSALSHAAANHETYTKKAEEFKAEKGLKDRPERRGNDYLRQINDDIEELNSRRLRLLREISDSENEAEKLDELTAEMQRREEKLKKYKRDYEILCKTKELLIKAETQLKDRYISPIKNNFIKYANLLENALGEKVTITSNFEIRFERGGAERSEKYLSAGQLSICTFCFRIALIENMYKDEKPFLILDDPFVNLDENHLGKVKQMIKTLSNDIQIIYFTCHESRDIPARTASRG